MSRLGIRVGLASYLAHDQIGLDILSAMRGEDVGTDLVHVDSPSHTVRNFVLSFGNERTILVRHADFNYKWKGFRDHEVPAWLYVNSLGPDALSYQDELADWLDAHPNVRLAFQPGTFQVEAGTKRLRRMYERAEVLLCSQVAAQAIAGTPSGDVSSMLDALMKLGPRSVVVFNETDGALAAHERERLSIGEFFEEDPPLDVTGAGDAFAATIVAASRQRSAVARGAPLGARERRSGLATVRDTNWPLATEGSRRSPRRGAGVHRPRPLGRADFGRGATSRPRGRCDHGITSAPKRIDHGATALLLPVHREFASNREERRGNGSWSLRHDAEWHEFGRDVTGANERRERSRVDCLHRRDAAVRREESI